MAQETVVEILAKFRADIADFNKKLKTVETELESVKRKTEDTSKDISSSFEAMGAAANRFAVTAGAVAGVAGAALISLGVKSFNAAAKVQELDTVMQVVGSTTGVTYKTLKETADAIRGNGIEMAAAQEIAIKFAKNNLNLADAANVARVAQDLAVISQANSTDTAERLTYATLNLNTMMLRNAGVQTTVSQAVRVFAKENNISAASMTTAQKQQAVLNAILKEGERIHGVYAMSMTNAGKVLRSFARITNDIQVALGGAFLDAFGPLILAAYELYKSFSLTLREGGALYPIIQALSAVFQNLAQPVTDAIVKITEFVKNMKPIGTSVFEMGTQIQKVLPILAALTTFFAAKAGTALLAQVPIIGQLVGAINPLAAAMLVLIATSPRVRTAFINLFASLKPLLPVFMKISSVIIDVFDVALAVVAESINMLAGIIKSSIAFIKENAEAFKVIATVVGTLTVAIILFSTTLKVAMAIQLAYRTVMQAYAIYTYSAAAATGLFSFALNKLKAAFLANPIGFVIAGLVALAAIFVVLWNRSETFRKIVIQGMKGVVMGVGYAIKIFGVLAQSIMNVATGHLQILLKGLALLKVPGAKEALDALRAPINAVGDFFDKVGNKVQDFADKLDGLEKKRFKLPNVASSFKLPKTPEKEIYSGTVVPKDTELDGLGGADAARQAINNLREAIQKHNDFINTEFAPGFQKDSETARDTVIKSLSMLKDIFDVQARGLKGEALKNLEEAYWATDALVREFIPQAEELGAAFELINEAIDSANEEFKKVTQDRESAILDFAKLMRQPFGEPSQITKALSSAEATVDSIINMYDNLVEQINKRYAGIDPTGRDNLIKYLTNQTQMLVDLAKKRLIAADNLQKAQEALNSVVVEQKQFASDIKSSLSGFATALADISAADGAAVIQVIKTSSGLVITQMQESSSGVNKITDQLRSRLKAIQDFARNIKSLLAQGLNKDYIRQLLEAGPEAAGQTAQLLAGAGSAQINEINSIYSQIGSVSEVFSRDMADLFFSGAVESATAIRDGYASEYQTIMDQMDVIKKGIEEKLKPLSELGTNLGDDLAQGLIDSLTKKKDELVVLAESIATAISSALAKAGLGIGVGLDTFNKVDTSPAPEFSGGVYGQGLRQTMGGDYQGYNPDMAGAGMTSGGTIFDIKIDANMDESKAVEIVKNAIRGAMVAR